MCKSNTGECQTPISDAWDGNIDECMPNLMTMGFFFFFQRCNNSKTEIGGLSEGRKSPLIAQRYSNTQIMTLSKWIIGSALKRPVMDKCRFHAAPFGVIHQQ